MPDLRQNQRRALMALECADGLTRAQLARQLGLPKATVAGLIASLTELGLVVETAPSGPNNGRRPVGRPAKALYLSGPAPVVGTVVYSGGILTAAIVSYSGVLHASQSEIVGARDFDLSLLSQAEELLGKAVATTGRRTGRMATVVLGVPAPVFAPSGPTFYPPSGDGSGAIAGPGPAGHSYIRLLAGDVAERFASRFGATALVENDANLGALGEAVFGAGRDCESFLYLKLARGVGAGLVVGGKLHRGATGFAGELGHIHVRDDGPVCACGGRGCLHGMLGDSLVQTVQAAYDRTINFRDILDLASAGEPGPQRALADVGRIVGRPLADFVTLFNPAAIIVDGSFADAASFVVDGIWESLQRYAAPVAARAVTVMAGALGDDADVLGATALARATATAPASVPPKLRQRA
ncbi:MAG TPA: ROK family transcriptional regulator [Acidimicrobiales bacterium]|nr:ROK family transcriptional regulator [Acidimicrobiales bacterium]